VVIRTATKEDKTAIITNTALKESYQIEEPRGKWPTLVIPNIISTQTAEELKEAIRKFNFPGLQPAEFKTQFKLRFKLGKAGEAFESWVADVSPHIYHALMETQKILAGYSAVRVYPYVGVVRCGKCWGYGHTTTVRTVPQALRAKCGEAGHNHETNTRWTGNQTAIGPTCRITPSPRAAKRHLSRICGTSL